MYAAITHKQDILRSFNEFNHSPNYKKLHLLEGSGILLDTDIDGSKIIKLYFLHGFFVERIEDITGSFVELIPYKSGYRIDFFLN